MTLTDIKELLTQSLERSMTPPYREGERPRPDGERLQVQVQTVIQLIEIATKEPV